MNHALYVAHQALARGHFDEAMSTLEVAQVKATGTEQATLKLHLASLYALCRAKGQEGALLHLNEAVACDALIIETALYKSLAWQMAAYQGEPLERIRQGLAQVLSSGQLLPQFHAADALIAAGGFRRAERVLTLLTGLPEHLEWRRASLMGEIHIKKADWRGALRYYTKSVQLCKGNDIQAELLSLAECWLHLSAPDNALTLLAIKELSDTCILEESRIRKGYITGLSYLMMEQPKRALEAFLEVYSLSSERGTPSFDLLYQMSKAFAACGDYDQAAAGYVKAIEAASADMLPFVRHAYGVTLAELGRTLEAKSSLSQVVADASYAYQSAAMIDLAEVHLQLGETTDAEALATKSLESPEAASACLCLAKIALEYFREDEAVSWLERAIADSNEAEEVWIAAHVLLADVLVQMHGSPQRIVEASQKAIKYLPVSDEWTAILHSYVARFEHNLGNAQKFMN
jgi:tetratricopeptide (TPR) repeat protein